MREPDYENVTPRELKARLDVGGRPVLLDVRERWEFDENGLMKRRDASINDYEIDESERRIF